MVSRSVLAIAPITVHAMHKPSVNVDIHTPVIVVTTPFAPVIATVKVTAGTASASVNKGGSVPIVRFSFATAPVTELARKALRCVSVIPVTLGNAVNL